MNDKRKKKPSVPQRAKNKVEKRPAETGGIAAAVGLLVGKALGIDDPDTIVALGVVVGFIPALITWLVSR